MKTALTSERILRTALKEQRICMAAVYAHAKVLVATAPDTEPEFTTGMGAIPNSFYSVRKNLFSTLFQSTYQLLDISPPRRHLYGQLIHLFRIWVTSADNLLDDEDKIVLPLQMPGSSFVMRQVVALLAADRVMNCILDESVQQNLITAEQRQKISAGSLQALLPSAAQEASEEAGVTDRPDPEYVLHTIHKLKTGILFNIPFMAPEIVEASIDLKKMARLKLALLRFGLGCQLLDDIRDMARDYVERRHNYCLSILFCEHPQQYGHLAASGVTVNDRLYQMHANVAVLAARRGIALMRDALNVLTEAGLGLSSRQAESMSRGMLAVLDLGDLKYA